MMSEQGTLVWVTQGHVGGTPPRSPDFVFHRWFQPNRSACGMHLPGMIWMRTDTAERIGRRCKRCWPELGL